MKTKKLGLTSGSLVHRVKLYEFQFDLFRKAGLKTSCAERSEFVLNDEAIGAVERGEEVDLGKLGNYKLVTRERPLRIFDTGSGCRSVEGAARYSYAKNACGLDAMSADETKLFLAGQMVSSVESHETTAFAGSF